MNDSSSQVTIKQGASIGGWCCFIIGLAIMFYSVWMFFFYVPFFFVSFILAIVAIAQRRVVSGIVLIIALLIVPAVIWLMLSATRLNSFILDVDQKLAEAEVAGMSSIRLIPAAGSTAPPPSTTQSRVVSAPQPQTAAEPLPIVAPTTLAEPWFKVPTESLETLHARELQVGASRLFSDKAISLRMVPAFSPDTTLIAMLREVNFAPLQVLLIRLDTHEVVQSWTPSQRPAHIAWSGDGKRLAYLMNSDDVFAIFDRDKGEEIRVPLPTKLSFGTVGLAWDGDGLLIHRTRGRMESINLDTLKIDPVLSEDATDETVEQTWENILAKNGAPHPHAFLQVSGDSQKRTADVFAYENDKSFRKVILGPVPGGADAYFSRDLRHLIVYAEQGLTHAILTRSEASHSSFELILAIRETVGQKDWLSVKQRLETGQPVWGQVYGPLVNPLNGKVTGADRKNFRGVVQFTRWTTTEAGVRTVSEILPIRVGDVVVEIDHQRMGFSTALAEALKDRWYALQQPTDDVASPTPAVISTNPADAEQSSAVEPSAPPSRLSSKPKSSPDRATPKKAPSSREMSSDEFLRKAKALQKR